jgi:ABC-type nitrate/sulfonate/bicarbonate transport system permease component
VSDVTTTVDAPARPRRRSLWARIGESTLYAIGFPIVLLTLWGIWVTATEPKFVPTPSEIIQAFVDTWVGPAFFDDVLPSLARLAVGLLLSIAAGIAVGTLVGLVRPLRELVEPIFEFFRAIPPPVMIPVITVILGATNFTKVVIIVLGAVWPILLNTIDGVRATDSVMKETARSFRLTRRQRLWELVLPAAMPRIMTGVRQAMSIALILMVISEMSNTSAGLGNRIVYFQRNYLIAEMWSGIVLLGLVGVLLATIFGIVERRMLRWYHGVKETERG